MRLPALSDPSISPDGSRVIYAGYEESGTTDIWVQDIDSRIVRPVTTDPGAETEPTWSPDGTSIAFNRYQSGLLFTGTQTDIYLKSADGKGNERLLTSGPLMAMNPSWSPNGKYMLYQTVDPENAERDIWYRTLNDDNPPVPIVQTKAQEDAPELSPDGRYLAYQSNQSGIWEIYIMPFPDDGGGSIKLSTNGGALPRWSTDSRELFYLENNDMMVMAIETTPELKWTPPEKLFTTTESGVIPVNPFTPWYDVDSNGRRFVMIRNVDQNQADTALTVVQNWIKEFPSQE